MFDTLASVFGTSDDVVKIVIAVGSAIAAVIGAVATGVAKIKKAMRGPRARLFAKVRRIEDALEITLASYPDPAIKDLLAKMKKQQRDDADAKDAEDDTE